MRICTSTGTRVNGSAEYPCGHTMLEDILIAMAMHKDANATSESRIGLGQPEITTGGACGRPAWTAAIGHASMRRNGPRA